MARCLCIVLCLAAATPAAEFYASPDGRPNGTGDSNSPWDLATAVAGPEALKPGDTLWLKAGVYKGGFHSKLTGQPDRPITVRGEPGAKIDLAPRDERDPATFMVHGADTIYRDLEFTCTHPVRETKTPGSWPAEIRRGSVDLRGDRISLINCDIHDLAVGASAWSEGEGGEISGCLIYYNGWRGPDRGHGHGIYAQNAHGTKRIADNILFHQFAYGIHAYGSEKASLKGFDIEGNIAFENGCLTKKGDNATGIMVGGATPAERIQIRDNVVVGSGIRVGYPWGTVSEDVTCTGNYCEGLVVRDFKTGTIRKNRVVAHSTVVSLEAEAKRMTSGLIWDENNYTVTDGRWGDTSIVESGKSRGLTFAEWQQATGFDAKSTFTKGKATQPHILVRPNAHERGRGHVAIVNPAGDADVAVDLAKVLKPGDRFRVLSAKDVRGMPLVEATYDGQPVRIPMKQVSPPKPVGMPDVELPVTEPYFGAFVVLPVK